MGLTFKDLYLTAFNAVSLVGWTYIQFLCWRHIFLMDPEVANAKTYSLYTVSIAPVVILQSSQWVELVHTLLKLTKSNLIIQICQLGGRFSCLILCLLYAYFNSKRVVSTEAYCNEYLDFGYVLLLLVWSMAEVIRYPFYICKLLGVRWTPIEWLRYNAFLVLYPIGFGAEMRCWWGLMQLLMLKDNKNDP